MKEFVQFSLDVSGGFEGQASCPSLQTCYRGHNLQQAVLLPNTSSAFKFLGGSCMQFVFGTAVVILIVAILIQCMAQAARIGFSVTCTPAKVSRQQHTFDMTTHISVYVCKCRGIAPAITDGNWLLSQKGS